MSAHVRTNQEPKVETRVNIKTPSENINIRLKAIDNPHIQKTNQKNLLLVIGLARGWEKSNTNEFRCYLMVIGILCEEKK